MRIADELDRTGHEIIGAAMAVHKTIGAGCFESAYAPCLAYELVARGLDFRTAVPVPLRYGELVIPRAFVADFIVANSIVIELKAISRVGRVEEQQLLTYLRLTGCPLGYLLNFGAPTLAQGVVRRVNNFPAGTRTEEEVAALGAPVELAPEVRPRSDPHGEVAERLACASPESGPMSDRP